VVSEVVCGVVISISVVMSHSVKFRGHDLFFLAIVRWLLIRFKLAMLFYMICLIFSCCF